MSADDQGWYWCMRHQTAEQGQGCRALDRLGPYATAEDARNWRQSVERRNRSWDDADDRWERGKG